MRGPIALNRDSPTDHGPCRRRSLSPGRPRLLPPSDCQKEIPQFFRIAEGNRANLSWLLPSSSCRMTKRPSSEEEPHGVLSSRPSLQDQCRTSTATSGGCRMFPLLPVSWRGDVPRWQFQAMGGRQCGRGPAHRLRTKPGRSGLWRRSDRASPTKKLGRSEQKYRRTARARQTSRRAPIPRLEIPTGTTPPVPWGKWAG